MLYEFALQPELLYEFAKSKRNFSDFIARLSHGSPFVFSEYPKLKNIRKRVLKDQPSDLTDLQRERLIEIFRFLEEINKVKRDTVYDGSLTWIENVVNANENAHFDYVFGTTKEQAISTKTIDFFFESQNLYSRDKAVKRTAKDLSDSVASMLRLAKKIIFIDPYFSDKTRNWSPFLRYIDAIFNNSISNQKDITFLFTDKAANAPNPQFLLDKVLNDRRELLQDSSVAFISIEDTGDSEKVHNRYILTDIGGVLFGIGLDEGSEKERDDLIILGKNLYPLRWEQYVVNRCFKIVDQANKSKRIN